jgi:hypothetical protein
MTLKLQPVSQPRQKVSSPKQTDQLWSPPGLQFNRNRGLFPQGQKQPRHEVDRSPTSKVDVKNGWDCTVVSFINIVTITTTILLYAKACTANHGPLIREVKVQSSNSPCAICGAHSSIWRDFAPSTLFFPSVSFNQCFTGICHSSDTNTM